MLRGSAVEMAFRKQFAYKAATMAGMATNLFWGVLRAYVFEAVTVASAGGTVAGYGRDQLFTYSGLTQAFIPLLLVFGWYELMLNIKTGDIATDLCRPVRLFWFWLAKDAGRCLHDTLFRSVPLFALYAFFMPVVVPDSFLTWLVFFISLVLAYLVCFSWRFVVNCLAFWTLDARGFCSIAYMTALVLMGFIIPVEWFPEWLQRVVVWTPFPALISIPAGIFVGRLGLSAVPAALLRQLVWLVILVLIAHGLLYWGTRKLVIQGG